jgi:hypothetical protein
MSLELEQFVGPRTEADGHTDGPVRISKFGAAVTQDAHGRYYEAVSRGNVYFVADQSGKTVPAGLSVSPTTVTLFNPKNSGVNGIIMYAAIDFIVAFAAGAAVWVAANSNIVAADVSGTIATPQNALIGSGKQATIKAFTAATLPAAPVAIAQLGAGLTGAITTAPTQQPFYREFAGGLILGPGGALSFQASTAGGASGALGEWGWEEVAA